MKKYITSNFVSIVASSNISEAQKTIRLAYVDLDKMDDPVLDERNDRLVGIANAMIAGTARIQRETGVRLISKYLKTDAEKVGFALEVYDAFNEAYANTIRDGYTATAAQ